MIKISFNKTMLFIALGMLFTPAYSNDSAATVGAGGIQFKKSDAIRMDEEILKISPDKIDISYRFFNYSHQRIDETIAFPLPPASTGQGRWPGWDENYIAHKFLQENPINHETQVYNSNLKNWIQTFPFIDFERTVNGVKQNFHYRVQAIDPNGKDITKILTENNIPLSETFLTGYTEEGEMYRNPSYKTKLKKLNLLNQKDLPNWVTQTTYFWNQSFEPKKEIFTTHRYTPATGLLWLKAKDAIKHVKTIDDLIIEPPDFKQGGWSTYCLSKADEVAILQLYQKNAAASVLPVKEVKYILTTGANWSGPIKNFRLEVTQPSNTLVFACWPGKMETFKNEKLVTNLTNFTPKKDLQILFVYYNFGRPS